MGNLRLHGEGRAVSILSVSVLKMAIKIMPVAVSAEEARRHPPAANAARTAKKRSVHLPGRVAG
jgi:hypothetical protein